MIAFSNQKPRAPRPTTPEASSDWSCAACAVNALSLCAAVGRKLRTEAGRGPAVSPLGAMVQKIPARRTICHPDEQSEFVPVICQGWAAVSVALQGGRRQILSFLLPGDIVSMACLFGPISGRIVESVTDVTVHSFKRDDLKAFLLRHPDTFEIVTKAWIEEEERSNQLTVDLGRRTAIERLARLILNLADRLAKRGMMHGQTMEFPLRQHHIADAVGLTPVHVSKMLGEFQRDGLIEINNRSLTIGDAAALRRMGGMH